ncbi:MAG: hypothetical protein JJ971_08370 [Balneolaceae bacterium]|nr:hypothetical protein [Balneolaceae bacterium]MBO6546747.1 hypothetical protein [Balneolaceae bacterium]MBO6649105.1 hypothetical protein [Balneolaceae bacterium]
MRIILLGIVVSLAFSSCKTSGSARADFYETKRVSIMNQDFDLVVNTPWFNNDLADELTETSYVEEMGNDILDKILTSYPNQVFGVEKVPLEESNVRFELKKLTIKRAYISINFPNPGPIYRVLLDVDIYEKGVLLKSKTLRSRVNMSEVNFGHMPFKWLNEKERKDPEHQLATLEAGLRNIYQKLYFNYFNISLSI